MARFDLWLLKPRDDIKGENPWEPWYDKAFGFVVEARSEAEARQLANEDGGDECGDPWLDPEMSTCERLRTTGKPRIVIQDFRRA